MRIFRVVGMILVAAAGSYCGSGAANAQVADTTSVGSSAGSPQVLQEIVVVAQRRPEKEQDVPISITALSHKFLEERQMTSISNLGNFTPDLRVQQPPGNATAAQLAIRGSVTLNPALSWDPAVGLYLDGVYIGKTQGDVFDIPDLERVEVLRGPQGTLYGRNSLAGAINLITAKPTGIFGGTAQLGAGNYGGSTERVSMNLPAVGPLKVNFSAVHSQHDGFIRVLPDPLPVPTVPHPNQLESKDVSSARTSIWFDPNSTFAAGYSFDVSSSKDTPQYGQLAGTLIPFLQPYVTTTRQDVASIDGPAVERTQVLGHAVHVDWKPMQDLTLKSISSYRTLIADLAGDYDGTPVPLINADRDDHYYAYSEELQALVNTRRTNAVVGAYYFHDNGEEHNDPLLPPGPSMDSRSAFRTWSRAVYGQVDYKITDAVTLTGGLRYTREEKEVSRLYSFLGFPLVYGSQADGSRLNSAVYHNVSPTAIVAYQLNPEVNLYAKWARGFKSGGFNTDAVSNSQFDSGYKPELMDSYETGAKTRLFGGRLQLDADVFYNKSKDMQISVFAGGTQLSSIVTNAGRATVWGAELETKMQLNRDLLLRATYSYLRPRYDQYLQPTATPGVFVNAANNTVFPLAPRNTASADVDWTIARMPVGVLTSGFDVSYTDSYYTYAYPIAYPGPGGFWAQNNKGDARALIDGRLSLEDVSIGSAKVELRAWVKNLTDKKYISTTLDFGPTVGGTRTAYWGDPRTFGGDVIVRW